MKKLYYLIVLTLILGLVLTGCFLSNVGQVPTTGQSGITYLTKATEGDPFVTPLLAGQTIDVGTVSVWNDDDYLYVTYNTTGDWVLTETHLAVVTASAYFPMTKKGNPKVGHFPYGKENIFMTTWEQTIEFAELEGWIAGVPLYIAAHAAIEEVTCFDGTPPGVTVEDTEDLYIGGSITVEALVKVESSSTNTDKYTIVGRWNDRDGDDRAWLLGVFNLYPCFYISDDGEVFPKAISGDKLITGQWYHLKGTFDSVTGEIKIYVDNVLKNTNNTDLVNIYLNDEPVLIGGDRAGGEGGAFFNGCIYEVKVWDDVIEGDAVLVLEWPETPVTESAWADGDYRFTEQGNWATYFTYPEKVLEVTQDSGRNDENRTLSRPHINWEIDGLCIEFEFVNPTPFAFVFDYRVDGEEGETWSLSDTAIGGTGECSGQLFGLKYNWVVLDNRPAYGGIYPEPMIATVQVCAEEEVWVGMRVGAENDWYLDWIIFEAKWQW